MKETEFKLSVITDQLNLPSQGVIVIWEWEWTWYDPQSSVVGDDTSETSFDTKDLVDHVSETSFGDIDFVDYVSETSFDDSIDHISETSFGDHDETDCSLEDDDPPLTSTVTFKCIGTQHDMHAQNILSRVSQLLQNKQQVPVNIYREPDNPYNAKAECWVDYEWHRIGYNIQASDDVHQAIESDSIKFAWAQCLIIWMRSGLGYYTGIKTTKYGYWSREVCHSASTR